MLRTGKQVWEATAKRRAIDLRREELEFHIQRFSVLITQCSVLVGFSFESIVHMEIEEDDNAFIVGVFHGGLSLSMIFSLYVVVTGSVLLVFGYQLAILGAEGDSLELAVSQMRARRWPLFAVGFASLCSLIAAGIALSWLKMGNFVAGWVTVSFALLGAFISQSVVRIYCTMGRQRLVTGATQFITPECAHRHPCTRGVHAAEPSSGQPRPDRSTMRAPPPSVRAGATSIWRRSIRAWGRRTCSRIWKRKSYSTCGRSRLPKSVVQGDGCWQFVYSMSSFERDVSRAASAFHTILRVNNRRAKSQVVGHAVRPAQHARAPLAPRAPSGVLRISVRSDERARLHEQGTDVHEAHFSQVGRGKCAIRTFVL